MFFILLLITIEPRNELMAIVSTVIGTMLFNKSGVYVLQVQEKNSGRMLSQKLVIGQ